MRYLNIDHNNLIYIEVTVLKTTLVFFKDNFLFRIVSSSYFDFVNSCPTFLFPDSGSGSSSSMPRLEPFSSGQIYNSSRTSRVHVLPATSAASATATTSTSVVARSNASPMSHLHLVKIKIGISQVQFSLGGPCKMYDGFHSNYRN